MATITRPRLLSNTASKDGSPKMRTQAQDAWRRFRRHRSAVAGLMLLLLMLALVTFGPIFYTASPFKPDFAKAYLPMGSPNNVLGTDDLGRDMLARMLFGGRISLAVGLFAMMISVFVGVLVGSMSGYFGGMADFGLMRFTDLFLSLPVVPVLLLVTYLFRDTMKSVFGREAGVFLLIVGVIGVLTWMTTARLVRSSFLELKGREFVEASLALGAPRGRIMFRHILPNSLGPIVIAATLTVGGAIITESVLSFLGVGFEADWPTWGSLVFTYKDYIGVLTHALLLPALAIFLVVLAVNYIGDGLRDALDPRRKH